MNHSSPRRSAPGVFPTRVRRPRRSLGAALVALACCAAACSSAPPLPPAALAHNAAGAEALAQGDLETASANLEVAVEYNPEFVDAVTNLGLVEMGRGNFDRARQLFERAKRLNPDFAQPHHSLGVLAELEHRPDVASEHYEAALKIDPGFAAARGNLARLLLQAGHVEHAMLQFRKLVQVDALHAVGHAGLTECLIKLDRLHEAEAQLEQARSLLGDLPQLTLQQARLELQRGELDRARATLAPLTRGHDDVAVAALAWSAVADLGASQAESALAHARRAYALDPEHPLTLYALAIALDDLQDAERVAWLERARAANPGNPELQRRSASAQR